MNIAKLAVSTTLASALLALTGASVAADPSYSSTRQQRMDAAYQNYRSGGVDRQAGERSGAVDSYGSRDTRATGNVREDMRRFGKGMKRGAKQTGHAIADGARDTGRAFRDTGKRAKDAVTGK